MAMLQITKATIEGQSRCDFFIPNTSRLIRSLVKYGCDRTRARLGSGSSPIECNRCCTRSKALVRKSWVHDMGARATGLVTARQSHRLISDGEADSMPLR